MSLYLIDIHWERRTPEQGRPTKGFGTYPAAARSLNAAKAKAVRKFNHTFGTHLKVTATTEKQDPAGIVS